MAIAASWAPYFFLKLYWIDLISRNPDAAHGEVSGPVLYFLPRLLAVACAVSVVGVGIVAWLIWTRR